MNHHKVHHGYTGNLIKSLSTIGDGDGWRWRGGVNKRVYKLAPGNLHRSRRYDRTEYSVPVTFNSLLFMWASNHLDVEIIDQLDLNKFNKINIFIRFTSFRELIEKPSSVLLTEYGKRSALFTSLSFL